MTERDENLSLFSDMSKDLYGCRPGQAEMQHFAGLSLALQRTRLDRISRDVEEELREEREARDAFRAKVRALGLDPEKYIELAY